MTMATSITNNNNSNPKLTGARRKSSLAFMVAAISLGTLAFVVLVDSSSDVLRCNGTKLTRNLAAVAGNDASTGDARLAADEMSKKIAIIHLGKCHGIGMQHSLLNHKETSAIVKQGYDWYHMERVPVEKHTDFIALMRNPIDRIISAYLFEHPKNAPFRKNPMHVTLPYAGKLKLYDCYYSMDDLATRGMALLPAGQEETDCSALAKKLLHDYMSFPGMTHFVYNYQSYYTELLQQARGKNIYAVRAEHMLDDMNAIERILVLQSSSTATDNSANKPDEFPDLNPFSHYKPGHSGKSLPITDKTVSEAGMRNLCELLCEELMRYKYLANEAKNLNAADQVEMQARVKNQCPHIADLERCPNNRVDFPSYHLSTMTQFNCVEICGVGMWGCWKNMADEVYLNTLLIYDTQTPRLFRDRAGLSMQYRRYEISEQILKDGIHGYYLYSWASKTAAKAYESPYTIFRSYL